MPSKPNVVFIVSDDQGYQDVSYHEGGSMPTPNIDSIASDGVAFSSAFVSAPVCGPSRAGLLTGRYQDRYGFCCNPTSAPFQADAGLPYDEETVGELLRRAGYATFYIGKWHLGTHAASHPLSRGFDRFYGFLTGAHRCMQCSVLGIEPTHAALPPPCRASPPGGETAKWRASGGRPMG